MMTLSDIHWWNIDVCVKWNDDEMIEAVSNDLISIIIDIISIVYYSVFSIGIPLFSDIDDIVDDD